MRAAALIAAVAAAPIAAVAAAGPGMPGRLAFAAPAGMTPQLTSVSGAGVGVSSARVAVGPEPDGSAVDLDVSVFTPGTGGRQPAVLLAHGFGGSKADLSVRATDLASHGYVVLTYTARGFGASGGRVHLDDPAFEVADARRLIDLLAGRPDVRLDGPGDPKVAIIGTSYGGALALMTAGTDRRVDALVPAITWNDLSAAFFPQSAAGPQGAPTPAGTAPIGRPGPLKALWASSFFQSPLVSPGPAVASGAGVSPDILCGRFDPVLCRLFTTALQTGRSSDELLTALRAHSPAPSLGAVRAPTLLIQGMADSLFGLDQADATARALAAAGTPVAVRWIDGGHDGASSTATADDAAAQAWVDHYLRGATPTSALAVPAFVYADPIPRRSSAAPLRSLAAYPGLGAAPSLTRVALPLKAAEPQT
ncbi:MAG TPA: alpha/beta fold hydrolase, partial [Candidatus Lustribacter sp.]|nr:alpha/beta fold hydrolase [Candidatus Lustribacter sp.]